MTDSHWDKINVSIGLYSLLEALGNNPLLCPFQLLEDSHIPWFVAPSSILKASNIVSLCAFLQLLLIPLTRISSFRKLCGYFGPIWISSVQFSHSVVSDSFDPMNHSMPGLPVHHQLLESTQTHVRRVGDAIQPSHSLLSPSLPAPSPSQHQSLNPE